MLPINSIPNPPVDSETSSFLQSSVGRSLARLCSQGSAAAHRVCSWSAAELGRGLVPVPAVLFAVRFVPGKELRCAASSEESMEAVVVPRSG